VSRKAASPLLAFATGILALLLPSSIEADNARPSIKILVNQAGYDTAEPKRVILQTDFDSREISDFEVTRGSEAIGRRAWRGVQRIDPWGLWFRTADLPSFPAGEYRIRVFWQGSSVESPPFQTGPDRLLKKTAPLAAYFFYAQRCGCDVPGWHRPCHLDDAQMPDGSRRDLAGGWHDAGDYNKYNGYTPLSVYALAKFARSPGASMAAWDKDRPTPLEESVWGARWLEKCRDPLTGRIIGRVFSGYGFWGPPEQETDNTPGTADDRPVDIYDWNENEMTTAGWAALYLAGGDAHWKNLALEMWEIVEGHDPGLDLGQRAKRLLAAIELYRAAQESRFALAAERDAVFLVERQTPAGDWLLGPMAIVDYGLIPAALAEYVRVFPESPASAPARESLRRYLLFWAPRRLAAFGILKWSEKDTLHPPLPGEWYVGQNSMYLSLAWAGLTISKLRGREYQMARAWAADSLDWVLGVNPFGVCMMYGAGSVHLGRYHHRYEQIPNGQNGNVPGAIANGIVRLTMEEDVPYLDLEGNWWRTNEPWLPHNAYFLLALSELARGDRTGPRDGLKAKAAGNQPIP
jgi:hypothetical protein